MRLDIVFEENEQRLPVKFSANDFHLSADLGEVHIVNEIPKEYGLITYDHNRTITVS